MAAPARPNPNTAGTTYLNIPSVANEIRAIRRSTDEGHISGIWNAILNWTFDPVNGYITRPQNMHRARGRRGFSDFHTLQYFGANRRFFLITQCKRPTPGDAIWEEGRQQLDRYLSMQHRTRPANARPRVYGILAVGRYVRFYIYSDNRQGCNSWRPGRQWAETHEDQRGYDILNEAHLVQNALRFILNNH
ncbi:hypothetical protein Aspvir_005895 [Aspergillus viridinutans]|uniref:Uncharacterized protein n=1 Tax=Aspergillus viridinutans TaxID=75553 RepID=A0A9P3C0K9_ASPVI|nr:uncharacterized protein Aspvir_005895 [Aspergillus viridinutans]GIK01854.1 hypothetical protein Aspvir_005895 [Aspergillus viridinutans]